MKFKILDLFCGAGGFSLGLEQNSEFKTVVATDWDKNALETFKHNFPDSKVILGNIADSEIKKELILESKKLGVNMIIGGPPCQGFSNKGKKLGLKDERNFLFLEYLNIVEQIQPELFIIENVKTLLTASDGFFIDSIKKKINELGYVLNYQILNAHNFGVPQLRERAFIIAHRNKHINFPKKITSKTTVFDAISDLSYLESGQGNHKSDYLLNAKSEYQKIMRQNALFLLNHQATKHNEIALQKLKLIKPEKGKECLPEFLIGKQKFKTTWGRLKWNQPSPTIDTRFDTPSNGTNSHPYLHRAITPREAARIQSFFDTFEFLGPKTSVCRQIGNAVPPLVAKAIGKAIVSQLSQSNVEENQNAILYNSDALNIVQELINQGVKVDHIITDPPYNISQKNSFVTLTNAKRKGIDFGDWDHNFDLLSWIKPFAKLINKNGSFIIFCSYKYMSFLIQELEKNDFIVKDVIKWIKTNPMPRNVQRRYVQDTEFAIWAVKKNSKWIFNKPVNVAYLRASVETSVVSGKEKTIHSTQKSLKLMKFIIEVHTNKNDLILDPFMGSGSTGLACKLLGRKFIGIEKNKEYYKIAKKRIFD